MPGYAGICRDIVGYSGMRSPRQSLPDGRSQVRWIPVYPGSFLCSRRAGALVHNSIEG